MAKPWTIAAGEKHKMGVGFEIRSRPRKVGAEIIAGYIGLPVANVSDAMPRHFQLAHRLRPMSGQGMAGPALTVRTTPGDNLMAQHALDLAEPGDVIVIDAGGEMAAAIVGEIMSNYAAARGIAGIVVYGAVRDLTALRAGSLPVYALGLTPRGPDRVGPGEINIPLNLDGMVIEPGDLILGDADGVVCVPFDIAASIGVAARARQVSEDAIVADIRAGRLPDRSGIKAAVLAAAEKAKA